MRASSHWCHCPVKLRMQAEVKWRKTTFLLPVVKLLVRSMTTASCRAALRFQLEWNANDKAIEPCAIRTYIHMYMYNVRIQSFEPLTDGVVALDYRYQYSYRATNSTWANHILNQFHDWNSRKEKSVIEVDLEGLI